MERVRRPEEVPTEFHYAVVEFRDITVGYQTGDKELCPHYYITEDRDDWERHITNLANQQDVEYVAFKSQGKVKVKVKSVFCIEDD